jgi:hypothetical protein
MTTTTLYRVDDYGQFGVGELIGFFESLTDAEHALEMAGYAGRINYTPDRNYGEITAFVIDDAAIEGGDIDDNEAMLSSKIWGAGEIIDTLLYR